MRSALLLLAALLAVPGCNGNIGDVFAIFPEEAFQPGDGTGVPGAGGGQPGVPFVPAEIAAIAGGQGVTGDVRNIAVANVQGVIFAFLTAQTEGVHVVEVTDPDLIDVNSRVTTIRDAVLTGGAAIAGGRVDAITVVDNTFLVCVAVGTGAANAVTVFDIQALILAATSPSADLTPAFVTPMGAGIPVPGNSAGRGGGVAGVGGLFAVATGGPDVIGATIDGDAGTWMELPTGPLPLGTTVVAETYDILVNQAAVYVTGMSDTGNFGLIALSNPALSIPTTPEFFQIDDDFSEFNDSVRDIAGPGNFPLDLALDTFSLYVTGDEEVFVYNVTNPLSPSLITTVENAGFDVISVAGDGGVFVVGAGDALQVGANIVGQVQLTASVSFPGTFAVRGVALLATDQGNFALCCAGDAGLRVVQLTQTQQRG